MSGIYCGLYKERYRVSVIFSRMFFRHKIIQDNISICIVFAVIILRRLFSPIFYQWFYFANFFFSPIFLFTDFLSPIFCFADFFFRRLFFRQFFFSLIFFFRRFFLTLIYLRQRKCKLVKHKTSWFLFARAILKRNVPEKETNLASFPLAIQKSDCVYQGIVPIQRYMD